MNDSIGEEEGVAAHGSDGELVVYLESLDVDVLYIGGMDEDLLVESGEHLEVSKTGAALPDDNSVICLVHAAQFECGQFRGVYFYFAE